MSSLAPIELGVNPAAVGWVVHIAQEVYRFGHLADLGDGFAQT